MTIINYNDQIRQLSAYFFVQSNDADPNHDLSLEEIQEYKNIAVKFVNASSLLISAFQYHEGYIDKELAQKIFYDVAKTYYDENNILEYFKLIYQLLFKNSSGPRLGTFVSLFGPTEFIELFQKKLNNPFCN